MSVDYDIYIMSKKEKIIYALAASAVIYVSVYIFYHSHILSIILCPLAFLYLPIKTKELIQKRKNELSLQFRDMLYSISSSLCAGKSIEMSLKDALKDLSIIYSDDNAMIIKEVESIVKRLEVNGTIEHALMDLANRSGIEDIENFAEVFRTSKRTGCNLVEVMKNTTNIISDKLEVMHEIDNLLVQRKLEQKILNALPIVIIILLTLTSGDYMEPVFTKPLGRLAMTISLALLAIAWYISKQIMNIRI